MPTENTTNLVLVRSDAGDGGWSLHPAGSTPDAIREGTAPVLACGQATMIDGGWDRPNPADYETALRAAAARGDA